MRLSLQNPPFRHPPGHSASPKRNMVIWTPLKLCWVNYSKHEEVSGDLYLQCPDYPNLLNTGKFYLYSLSVPLVLH